jgi:two-component system, OmpR family, response regulator
VNRKDEPRVDVAIAKWPEEQARVVQLAQAHVPRLLLVRPDASAPVGMDVLEDWVRLPCEERDLRARVLSLQRRAIEFAPPPVVAPDGRFSYIGAVTYLPVIQTRLALILVDRFETVVSEPTLIEHGWEGVPRSSGSLRSQMVRLRHRANLLGLQLGAVRSQGWILHRPRLPQAERYDLSLPSEEDRKEP